MITQNEKMNESLEVEVKRVERASPAAAGPAPAVNALVPPLRLNLGGASPLSVRPAGRISAAAALQAAPVPLIRIRLHSGNIKINNRTVPVPLGLRGRMTARQFKKLFGIYAGNNLFIKRGSGLQRVRDSVTVEPVEDSEFRHQRPVSEFSSMRTMSSD